MYWNRNSAIITILFVIGLVVRILLMDTHGSTDLKEFSKWGKNVHEQGLVDGFQGGYFPVQYLIFGATHGTAEQFDLDPEQSIKILNLIFEIGCLLLLICLLSKHLSLKWLLVLFWLNPFAIMISQQGYVDAQFGFFILLTLVILAHRSSSVWKYLIAGIPIGISLQMKPQSAPLFVGLVILAIIFFFLKQRKEILKMVAIFVVPIILYGAYSLYFGINMDIRDGHQTLPKISAAIQEKVSLPPRLSDIIAGSGYLTSEYIFVATKRMPAINAQMPNAWFFVANALNDSNQPIYRIKDTLKFLGLIQYRTIGSILFFAAFIAIAIKILKSGATTDRKIILALSIIPILLPYLTTSAHENHFYLGFISTIILGAFLKNKFILWSGFVLATLNSINLIQYYILPHYSGISHSTLKLMPVTLLSSLAFFVLLYHLLFKLKTKDFSLLDYLS